MPSLFRCLPLILAVLLAACGPSHPEPDARRDDFMSLSAAASGPTATPAAVTASSATEPESGWWWNPAEGGRGYAIEKQGDKIFFAAFLYDDAGAPLWYVATGKIVGGVFSADLQHYVNGQTLTGPYKSPTTLASPGKISIEFTSGSTAVMSWPGGSVPIQRFDIVPGGSKLAASSVMQRGWWWNPSEGGRGFAMEIQGDSFFMAGFMYDSEGQPRWYLAQGVLSDPTTFTGKLVQYSGGQTLKGGYKSPAVTNDNVSPLTVNFASPTSVQMQPASAAPINLSRYVFSDTTAAPAETRGTLFFPVGKAESIGFVHLDPANGNVYATAKRLASGKVQPVTLAVQVAGGGYYTISYDENQLPTKVTTSGYTFQFSNIDVVNDTVNIKVTRPDGSVVTLGEVEFDVPAQASAVVRPAAMANPPPGCDNSGSPSQCEINEQERQFDETAQFFASARHHLVVDILWGLAQQAEQEYRNAAASLRDLSTKFDAAYAKIKAKLANASSKGPDAAAQFQDNDLVQQTEPFAASDAKQPENVIAEATALRSGASSNVISRDATVKPVTPQQPPPVAAASGLRAQIEQFLGCPAGTRLTIITGANVALLVNNDADLANASISRAMCKNIDSIDGYYEGKLSGKLVIYYPAIAPSQFADETRMLSISEYTNSRRNGIQKEYFTTDPDRGKVRLLSSWTDEKQNGPEFAYYPSGKVVQLQDWAMGFLVEHKEYYANGQLAEHALFGNDGVRNFRQGEEKSFAESGALISRKTWVNDYQCGTFENNDANGTPQSSGTYCDREASGTRCAVRNETLFYYNPNRKVRVIDSGDCNTKSTPG
ncbi:MAG: hypothetical protein KF686_04490 [Ramlibacter sp.]|nr:hypothetical protein [Ramlibacter sp.]